MSKSSPATSRMEIDPPQPAILPQVRFPAVFACHLDDSIQNIQYGDVDFISHRPYCYLNQNHNNPDKFKKDKKHKKSPSKPKQKSKGKPVGRPGTSSNPPVDSSRSKPRKPRPPPTSRPDLHKNVNKTDQPKQHVNYFHRTASFGSQNPPPKNATNASDITKNLPPTTTHGGQNLPPQNTANATDLSKNSTASYGGQNPPPKNAKNPKNVLNIIDTSQTPPPTTPKKLPTIIPGDLSQMSDSVKKFLFPSGPLSHPDSATNLVNSASHSNLFSKKHDH